MWGSHVSYLLGVQGLPNIPFGTALVGPKMVGNPQNPQKVYFARTIVVLTLTFKVHIKLLLQILTMDIGGSNIPNDKYLVISPFKKRLVMLDHYFHYHFKAILIQI